MLWALRGVHNMQEIRGCLQRPHSLAEETAFTQETEPQRAGVGGATSPKHFTETVFGMPIVVNLQYLGFGLPNLWGCVTS